MSREEGTALAKELKFLFHECSARTRENVKQCFEELALKVRNHILMIPFHFYTGLESESGVKMKQIMEVPSLLQEGSSSLKRKPDSRTHQSRCCS